MSRTSQTWAKPSVEARIGAHVQAWGQRQRVGQHLAPETYPFVTISREFGCEGLPLAVRLTEVLNERCHPSMSWVAYDQELLQRVADELHLQQGAVEAIDERRRDQMRELFESILNEKLDDTLVFRKLAEVIRSLAIHGHAVLVGRGSYLITQDLKNALHVRLVAPRGWRIYKVASNRGVSQRQAEIMVDRSERARAQFLNDFFVQDAQHPFYHDLVIDNARFNLEQVVEIVFCALASRFGERLVGA